MRRLQRSLALLLTALIVVACAGCSSRPVPVTAEMVVGTWVLDEEESWTDFLDHYGGHGGSVTFRDNGTFEMFGLPPQVLSIQIDEPTLSSREGVWHINDEDGRRPSLVLEYSHPVYGNVEVSPRFSVRDRTLYMFFDSSEDAPDAFAFVKADRSEGS